MKKAFTLVELIISITIIIILSTVGFLSYIKYGDETKDVIRIKDINNIGEVFRLNTLSGMSFPEPDNIVSEEIEIDGISGIKWKKGEFGEKGVEYVKSISKVPEDPVDKTKYVYYLSSDNKYYYLETTLENGDKYVQTNYKTKLSYSNEKPIITGISGKNHFNENETISLTINSRIGNQKNLPITYSASNLPSTLKITGNKVTGKIISKGVYNIVFYARDNTGKVSDGYNFVLTVRANQKPIINSINGQTSLVAGEQVNLTIDARDFDGNISNYKILNKSGEASLSISGNRIIGTSNIVGQVSFEVVANDGEVNSEPYPIFLNFSANNRSCEISNGTGSQTWNTGTNSWNTCTVTACNSGYTKVGNECRANKKTCNIVNGTGEQTLQSNGSYGTCTVKTCNANYHKEGNTCVSNTRSCTVSNGTGSQTWNTGTNSWNTCTVTACNSGYTLNSSKTACICNPIYLDSNGVTIKASNCAVGGQSYIFYGTTYYVAIDKNDIKTKINSGYNANRIVTSKLTDMSELFRYNNNFNQDISSWDVSKVTNMKGMFAGATSFNQPLNSWNVSKVTDMGSMFVGGKDFNQPLNSWNTSNVTNMQSMFSLARGFNQDISSWDVSKVTNMSYMFYFTSSFNQPLDSWNVSNVTDMSKMFSSSNFNQPLNSWNVGKVTNMREMFHLAYSFNQPLNSWNVSNVTDMLGMFNIARDFNQNINSWNVGKVTNMNGMFAGARNFNQPLNSWNVSNVTSMGGMFAGATSFNQDISSWDVSKVKYMGGFIDSEQYYIKGIFEGAIKFNRNLANWNTASIEPGKCNNFAPHLSLLYKPIRCY